MHGPGSVKNTVVFTINKFAQAVFCFLSAVERHILLLFCRPTAIGHRIFGANTSFHVK